MLPAVPTDAPTHMAGAWEVLKEVTGSTTQSTAAHFLSLCQGTHCNNTQACFAKALWKIYFKPQLDSAINLFSANVGATETA